MHRRLHIPRAILVAAAASTLARANDPERKVDFNRDVRPILSNHCFQCHGPDARQRKAGLRLDTQAGTRQGLSSGKRAIVPGEPQASELLRRVSHSDPAQRMPPPSTGKVLSLEQIDTLRRWITAGGEWSRHWAFVPPRMPHAIQVSNPGWVRNPIDAFVLARLEREGLAPSVEACKETLIRRVTFDLTGLPPTIDEVDAFLADVEHGAYERLVDRLLQKPQYAEHMARYWLDAARYGDTHGYHLDNYRNMWPYRDWVIRAFHENMPFDQFTIEQLAGDLLPHATLEQRVATGFNRCNVTTAEGGLIAEEYLAKYAMDRVETTSTVFLGLTMRCATCHDHKYDPFTQKDFYRLFAFFNSITEEASDKNQAIAPPFVEVPSPEQARRMTELETKVAALEKRMQQPMPAVDARQERWERTQARHLRAAWSVLTPASVLSEGGAKMRVQPDGAVLVRGHAPPQDVYEVVAHTERSRIPGVRLEALASAVQPGKGIGRAPHSNIVLSGFELEAAPLVDPARGEKIRFIRAAADYVQRDFGIERSLDGKKATGWAIDGVRRDLAAVYWPERPFGFSGGTLLRFRLRFESGFPLHTIGRFRLALACDDRAAPATFGPWHSIGPFPAASFDEAYGRAFSPEAMPGDEPRDLGALHGRLRWRPRPDLHDARIHPLHGAKAATYLCRTITAPSPRPMTFALGSDDAIKVWWNGELVLARKVTRAVAPDQDTVTVQLRAGTNRLLLKIVNGGGNYAFYFRVRGESPQGLEAYVANALLAESRSTEAEEDLRSYYRSLHAPEWKALARERDSVRGRLARLAREVPRTMVMQERKEPRPAHVLIRGQYDHEGELVRPDTPAALPKLEKRGARATRLDLARWLVAPEHPLTARVTVNRFWQQLFGTGLVKTSEDFGAQGEWPSHPALLDWLARTFVDSSWDVKAFMRLVVTSATYRQSSRVTSELRQKDPGNRLLARGPRFRLDAEVIRDNALRISGLLNPKIGGKSVKPYQPAGLWKAVGYTSSNTANFVQDKGANLYRRSLYTFWKRTAAPPTMQLFDAPSRESCRVRRERTNTPLQALALLNDVQHVEAARGFAQRILAEGGDGAAKQLVWAFRTATARRPDAEELATLRELLFEQLDHYRDAPAAATALIGVGDSDAPPVFDAPALAAWTTVANLLLNLDETITKG